MSRVFISGCFDLFHIGHLECLQFAAAQGDQLWVSIASDATVRALKREPIYSESERLAIIEGTKAVYSAFIARGEPSDWDFLPYLDEIKPHVWVVSWDDKWLLEKQGVADEKGIKLVQRIRPVQTPTTSSIIEKIKAL